jgi:hypothetical protein
MMNFDFVLIDLYSQRKAIYHYVDGWSKELILAWMCQYGSITKHTHQIANEASWENYAFIPSCGSGLIAAFHFTDPTIDGEQAEQLQVIMMR